MKDRLDALVNKPSGHSNLAYLHEPIDKYRDFKIRRAQLRNQSHEPEPDYQQLNRNPLAQDAIIEQLRQSQLQGQPSFITNNYRDNMKNQQYSPPVFMEDRDRKSSRKDGKNIDMFAY